MTSLTTQHGHRPNHGLVRMSDTQLPKLPDPEGYADPAYGTFEAFTADQMRAYASDAVRAALAAQGEPVAWMASYVDALGNDYVYVTSHHDLAVENDMHGDPTPLYTAPPAPAKSMTDEEISAAVARLDPEWLDCPMGFTSDLASAIEAHQGITAAPVTTLWCIHIPGPDELYAAPSKADAEHMAALHNAAMATYYASGALNLEYAPLLENVQAVAIPWPYDIQSHADQMREFDWSGWGIADKGGA